MGNEHMKPFDAVNNNTNKNITVFVYPMKNNRIWVQTNKDANGNIVMEPIKFVKWGWKTFHAYRKKLDTFNYVSREYGRNIFIIATVDHSVFCTVFPKFKNELLEILSSIYIYCVWNPEFPGIKVKKPCDIAIRSFRSEEVKRIGFPLYKDLLSHEGDVKEHVDVFKYSYENSIKKLDAAHTSQPFLTGLYICRP
jgi:hypothetical protein